MAGRGVVEVEVEGGGGGGGGVTLGEDGGLLFVPLKGGGGLSAFFSQNGLGGLVLLSRTPFPSSRGPLCAGRDKRER